MFFLASLAFFASLVFNANADIANHLVMVAHRENISAVHFVAVAYAESGLNPKAYNPCDIDGKEKFGLFQYDTDTWKYLTSLMKKPKLNINNFEDQISVFVWAIKNGEEWRWPSVKFVINNINFPVEGI